MKKAVMICPLLLIIPWIMGCTEMVYSVGQPRALTNSLRENHWANEWSSIKADYEGLEQQIQIFSHSGELRLTLTDNEDIFIFIKSRELDKWDYSVNEMPPEALRICTIVYGTAQDSQIITEAVESVYYGQDGYYLFSETPGGCFTNQMTDSAARYLMELAGLEMAGTRRFADHEFYGFGADTEAVGVPGAAASTAPYADLTFEGMLAASAENQIDIFRDGAAVQTISDNREVYAFLISLDCSEWTSTDSIPTSAAEVCGIVRYQLGRRELAGQIMAQSCLVLYSDGTEYYMDSLIADNGSGEGDRFNALYPQRFHIPAEVGDRLST